MKILEEKDSYEAIVTLGLWLGKDSFESINNLGKYVYEQLDNIDNCGAVQWHPEGNKGSYTYFLLSSSSFLDSLQFASLPGHESSCGAVENLLTFNPQVVGSNSLTGLNLIVSCGGW